MKFFLSLILTSFYCFGYTQDSEEWKDASKESQAYHEYRIKHTIPPYGLAKIKGLIKNIKSDRDDEDIEALPAKEYKLLTLPEKFTYHMIKAESYSQNCDVMPPIQDEQKKIFAQLIDDFGEYDWSERQKIFFIDNRDTVIKLMTESIKRTKRVGCNFKEAIILINAKEMIPFLVNTYNISKRDHDILTIFMLLMKDNKYGAFLSSSSYKKLYGDENASYKAWINYNKPNEELIIKRVTEFYNGLHL